MFGRRNIIMIEDFYSDPRAVRDYALSQKYYYPYTGKGGDINNPEDDTKYWTTTWYKDNTECPFKSSGELIHRLEDIIGEKIDLAHWNGRYPVNERSKPIRQTPFIVNYSCLWHCSFHVKFDVGQKLGGGIHNHVTDPWNSVGPNGWTGLIYLAEDAPIEGGLNLWRNKNPANTFDWMSPAENWIHLDRFANIYNRLILVRGDIPHSGTNGWGHNIETGRMYQTFFFKTKAINSFGVNLSRSDLHL